ncbi:hypothetical protein C7445_1164 [Alicyclobacillus sacchari]|uniref:Uncharacterized protein n=1 Tax=Alicyclobacillus sacchari TaxID=392010 RepID=A0A4R8LGP0_9BACL|nr:hypothetical protein [Alicyclobacillus sacchari]TDY42326.1 hypothetical protein C7445_1164 [Alicyclobacillus sacchari]GMA58002.1 hypothetical protein GCM10025858_25050 [Alicyclobacillus sacchari]
MTNEKSGTKPDSEKKWMLERPADMNIIRIIGNVYTTVSEDEFTDAFIEWLEGKGWSFFGRTVELTDEDDDNEIPEGILPKGAFDDAETE